jgi:nucleotide-binding universal stress UspA family protein
MFEAQPMHIILPVDGSKDSDAAIDLVSGIGWPGGASVRVLAVIPKHRVPDGLSEHEARVVGEALACVRARNRGAAETATTQVAEWLSHAGRRRGGLSVEPAICEGEAASVILERAESHAADLIVIGASGLSAGGEFRLGSTSHNVAEHASCSVLVARPLTSTAPRRIVLGIDGSSEAWRAVEWVQSLALPPDAQITILGIVEASSSFGAQPATEPVKAADTETEIVRQALIRSSKAHVAAAYDGLRTSTAQLHTGLRHGQAAAELVRYARQQQTDLLIIGARGQTQADPFRLGGVAEKLVRFAPCSVLVVR